MIIFYIGIQKDATHYERMEYGLVEMISKAGGFIAALFRGSTILVAVVCNNNITSKLMYLIYQKKANYNHRDQHTKKNIADI